MRKVYGEVPCDFRQPEGRQRRGLQDGAADAVLHTEFFKIIDAHRQFYSRVHALVPPFRKASIDSLTQIHSPNNSYLIFIP